jgi:methyl-accepting chemotaxis protein
MRIFAVNSRLSETKRLRSGILRHLILGMLIILPLFWLTARLGRVDSRLEWLILVAATGLIISFIFNRLGLLGVTGVFLGILLHTVILVFIFTDPRVQTAAQLVSPLLVLSIMITGLAAGGVPSAVIAILGIGALVSGCLRLIDYDTPGGILSGLSVSIVLQIMIAIITWVFNYSFQRLLNNAIRRSRELEASNEQLTQQRQLEQQTSDQLNVLAARISAAFAEQNRGANDQLVAVVQVTSAIEELNQTNEQIAQAANQVARAAHEALLSAERGEDTIRQNMDAVGILQVQVENTVHSMQGLSLQAEEIDQIIELITDVAEETDLLALNATIEAAGAGEFGRRFAAVASEVQRLANRSREAADQVRTVVNEVQEAIRTSTKATQQGMQDALALSQSVREIGITIEGMVSMVQNTANLAQQISFSIQQQKSAGGQIVDTMRQISDVSQNVALSSDELLETIFHLNQTADELKGVKVELPATLEEMVAEENSSLFPADSDAGELEEFYTDTDELVRTG